MKPVRLIFQIKRENFKNLQYSIKIGGSLQKKRIFCKLPQISCGFPARLMRMLESYTHKSANIWHEKEGKLPEKHKKPCIRRMGA